MIFASSLVCYDCVSRYDRVHIFHAAITEVLLLNIWCILLLTGKCFTSKWQKILSMLVFTFLEYGGLNHIIFLLLKKILFECFLPDNAFWYIEVDLSNLSLLDEVSDILFAIDFGNCFRTFGGWLDCQFIIRFSIWFV